MTYRARTTMMIRDLGELRAFIDKMPNSTPCEAVELTDIDFVIIVDSNGNAQKIPANTKRILIFHVEIPYSS